MENGINKTILTLEHGNTKCSNETPWDTDMYELLDSLINDLEEDLVSKLEENENYNNAKEYYMQMHS